LLRFGTDGVRGIANAELSPELVLALGRAAARVLGGGQFLLGRDTRLSGPLLQAALSAGLASEGADVTDVGVLPTPALAYLSASRRLPAAVVSASHNPFPDNGVKFFQAGGAKLADETEQALEAALEGLLAGGPGGAGGPAGGGEALTGAAVGRLCTDPTAKESYELHLLGCLGGRRLDGLRLVLDCANGAASATAPQIFRRAGAEVVAVVAAEPDGTNINEGCGSTSPERLASAVVAAGADLGLAFDGDADRVIAVGSRGEVVDGDRMLALFATDLAERGLLPGRTVVVTVMTNLGFHQAMAEAGVKVHTVAVGDRYVLEALEANGWALGGEQSGHIVFRSLATTGDGQLSGLLLADLVARKGAPLAELAGKALRRFPQVLHNVAVADRDGLAEAKGVWDELAKVQEELGERGRALLRPSGTEPVVRVMVEAEGEAEAHAAAERLVAALRRALGSPGQRPGD
jgi:phosphoglucosamine mutase